MDHSSGKNNIALVGFDVAKMVKLWVFRPRPDSVLVLSADGSGCKVRPRGFGGRLR